MNATRLVIAVVLALAVCAGNWTVANAFGTPSPAVLAWLLGAPIVMALILAFVPASAAPPVADKVTAAAPPP